MNESYSKQPMIDQRFGAADEHDAMMKDSLKSQEFEGKSAAAVGRWLALEQREMMRRLLQSHFSQAGLQVAITPVVGADGAPRTHVRAGAMRQNETLFGTVGLERTAHSGRGLSALHPVDASLNLPATSYSHEVERQVAKLASKMSFDATMQTMADLTGAHVPKRQAEQLVQHSAKDFEQFYNGTWFETTGVQSELLVLTYDQKGVVLRKEDLKEATRKAAENSKKKMDTRQSKGEKLGRKRMATVAAVYTIGPHLRTAEEIIAGLRHLHDTTIKSPPRPENKRVWASLTEALREVVAAGFDEAEKRDPERKKRWLVLIDGDAKLERWVREEAKQRGIEVTIVLDFIHALEYLWRAAHAFFDESTPEIEKWVLERLLKMLDGKISNVVAGMRRMATVRELTKKERAPVDKAANYLLKRKALMRYDKLLDIGAPIARGVIEGACRHLICDRLDITGARWRLPSAEAVLRLRSLISSGDFDAYWEFHEQEEARRNHASNYADGKVPPVEMPKRKAHLRLVGGVV